jgi:predicted TIM-barrel fold metal-dependent hydrolase
MTGEVGPASARVDAHTHIGTGPGERSAQELLAMLDRYEIASAIAFPGPSGLAGSPRQIAAANDYVARAARRSAGRIVGFGTANPWHAEEAWREIERLPELGLKGIKLHPPIQGFVVGDRASLDPVLERAAALDLTVVIDAGLRVGGLPYVMVSLEDIHGLADAFPNARIVVAHAGWGGRDARGADELARGCPNVWFDTAGVNMPVQIRQLVEQGAGDRLIYGSDFPFLHPKVELLRVELAELGDQASTKVLGGNAQALLGTQVA